MNMTYSNLWDPSKEGPKKILVMTNLVTICIFLKACAGGSSSRDNIIIDDEVPPDPPLVLDPPPPPPPSPSPEPPQEVPVKTLQEIQLEIFEGVEDVGFDEPGEVILNDVQGSSHQQRQTKIAKVYNVDTLVNPQQLELVAREGGDDIIVSPNNEIYATLITIDRISDPAEQAEAIDRLKSDLSGDIILSSAGNSGAEEDYQGVLRRPWVKQLLEEEDINVFFIVGTTNEDGETSISPISSTVPSSLFDYVIGAAIEFPISDDVISQGTSASATLVGVFFARLQVLLPEASFEELLEIGEWLLKPLEDTLGTISFEKFSEIELSFSKDADLLTLSEILDYIRANPAEEGTTLEEGPSGANQGELPQQVEFYDPPTTDDLPLVVDL